MNKNAFSYHVLIDGLTVTCLFVPECHCIVVAQKDPENDLQHVKKGRCFSYSFQVIFQESMWELLQSNKDEIMVF